MAEDALRDAFLDNGLDSKESSPKMPTLDKAVDDDDDSHLPPCLQRKNRCHSSSSEDEDDRKNRKKSRSSDSDSDSDASPRRGNEL